MSIGLSIPDIIILLNKRRSNTGKIYFIVEEEDKFISSAINIFPHLADSNNGPL